MAYYLCFMGTEKQKIKGFFKYFPTSEDIRRWGFYIYSIGHTVIPPDYPYPPTGHPDDHYFTWKKGRVLNSFTFVYIPQGQGIFESDVSGRVEITEGDLFIVYPRFWHRYAPYLQTGWIEYWIEFDGTCAKNFMRRNEFDPAQPVININLHEEMLNTFMNAIEIAQNESYGFQYLLSGLATNIIAQTLASFGEKKFGDTQKIKILDLAKRILLENFDTNLDLKKLASDLNVSYSWFRKAFKQYSGFSPRQYQLEFRIHRAKQMLSSSNLQISQIADKTGFTSAYYFSQLFKQKTGYSPLNYRNAAHVKSREN